MITKILWTLSGYIMLMPGLAGAQSAEEILKKADDIRNPSSSSKLVITIETSGEELVELDVSMQGKDKTLVKMLKPARDRGKNMLMLEEEMWVYIPNLKRTVRVSLNQKLSGQAANGDICRQRWSGDYEAKIEKENKKSWTLLLKAQKSGLTYDSIRLWIDKKNGRPLRTEYLTKSGKILKKAEFKDYKMLAGDFRPSVTVIFNATNASEKSVVTTVEAKIMKFPDSLFNQNSLN